MEKNLDSSIYSFERGWWWDCLSTLNEELKQLEYAQRMGLIQYHHNAGPQFDLGGKSVLDVGGGPVSLLLKTTHRGSCCVVDPIQYPNWVLERYKEASIEYIQETGENILNIEKIKNRSFDEAWIYNVLQHTIDPKLIITSVKKIAKRIRIFEWINIPPHSGHPHELKETLLNEWVEGKGTVEYINKPEIKAVGEAYYGAFEY